MEFPNLASTSVSLWGIFWLYASKDGSSASLADLLDLTVLLGFVVSYKNYTPIFQQFFSGSFQAFYGLQETFERACSPALKVSDSQCKMGYCIRFKVEHIGISSYHAKMVYIEIGNVELSKTSIPTFSNKLALLYPNFLESSNISFLPLLDSLER